MKRELQDKLIKKYPRLFNERPCGCSCYDGWYFIIDSLLDYLDKQCEYNGLDVKIECIKEKFGGLNIYISAEDFHNEDDLKYIYGAIRFAESLSYKTCEFCGSTKNIGRTRGWIHTCCKSCFDEGKTSQSEWKSSKPLNEIRKEKLDNLLK